MIQNKLELDEFHSSEDPWGYENNNEDLKRKEILLSELPKLNFEKVLDIGCGHGFITRDLPGAKVIGIDISSTAIEFAKKTKNERVDFLQGSIYEIDKFENESFDLIVITGVLYSQYIGNSNNLIYLLIDKILKKGGYLVTVHIDDWYNSQFPFLKLKQTYYSYRAYTHNLEIYLK
ncbi:class I SAM-dependent methyltransferase [Flavobacterium sp.]|uniref:class I SAM-dependent methyltransferase n=1 Tax=Flavobacterium sp. TaxID=239 RepID=UPI003D0EA1E8